MSDQAENSPESGGAGPPHKPEIPCKVCGDRSSGKHYSVYSCDGCRGFFKRSVRRNLAYVCKESGKCVVDVTRRNQCQACRFQKCLEGGMNKDAVQHERAPRCPRVRETQLKNGGGGCKMNEMLNFSGFQHDERRSGFSAVAPDFARAVQFPLSDGYSSHFLNSLLQNEPRMAQYPSRLNNISDHKHAKEDSKMPYIVLESPQVYASTLENVYEAAARLLFTTVKWARSIPSFVQLAFRDQAILIEEAWNELFLLGAAQFSFPFELSPMVITAGMQYERAPISPEKLNDMTTDIRSFQEIMMRFNALQVDSTEFACLKAIVLFKAETKGLRECGKVEVLRDEAFLMLQDHCARKPGSQRTRFGKLLLLLSLTKSVNSRSIEDIFFRRTIGTIPMEKLLCDMFKSS